MVGLFLAMTIATIIVCFLVTDTIEQFSRRKIVNTILEDFEGDFIVSRIAGKFDGLRISGTILDDAEFSRLADRLPKRIFRVPLISI